MRIGLVFLCLIAAGAVALGQTIRVQRVLPLAALEQQTAATYQCQYVGGKVTLDADLSEWAGLPLMDLSEVKYVASDSDQYPATWGGPQDLSAKFWLGWDETGLYVAAQVTDDLHVPSTSYGRYWDADSIALGFDPKNNASLVEQSEDDDREYYFGIVDAQGPEIVDSDEDAPYKEGKIAARFLSSDRGDYVVEAWIPWSGLEPLHLPASKACGFAILANDADGPQGQEGWVENVHALYGVGPMAYARLEFVPPAPREAELQGALVAREKSITGNADLEADLAIVAREGVPEAMLSVGLAGPNGVSILDKPLSLYPGENRFQVICLGPTLPEGNYALAASLSAGGRALWEGHQAGIGKTAADSLAPLEPYAAKWNLEAIVRRIRAQEPAPGEELVFAVMGDNRNGDQVFMKHMAYIEKQSPARFTVIGGDIVPSGTVPEWEHWVSMVDRLEKPIVPVIGNHDIGNGRKEYRCLFGERTDFYFDYAGCRFVGMDNAGEGFTENQLAWADKVIGEAKAQGMRVFVTAHKPPACIEKWAFHAFVEGDEEWVAMLTKHQVDGVFVGHIHSYDTALVDGVPFVLTGGAGVGAYDAFGPGSEKHHFIEVHVTPAGVRMEWVGLDHVREPMGFGAETPAQK